MERLLEPDTGLIIWTVVSFLVLVAVLGKFAWKPLIKALKEREEGIRKSIQDAQSARETAEKLRAQYEQDLGRGQEKVQALLIEAQADGQKLRDRIVSEAKEEAQKVMEKSRADIREETRKALASLKAEVARLSIMETEKLLRRSMGRKAQDEFLKEAIKDLEKNKELH